MNDMQKSQIERLNDISTKYKKAYESKKYFENLLNAIKIEIIDLMIETDLKKVNGVKLVEKFKTENQNIEDLINAFNDNQETLPLIKKMIVNVDIEATVEWLKFDGIQETLAKKIGKKLSDMQEKKYLDLEILK